ncbi:universal stress protein UspA [Mycobacterium sp. CBMA 234]|uniref:universal stress protein n=1 Tax=Mycolicibacterium sp. CBMA 234 TaxID=1918495 RepID=UPI001390B5C8|nr:universal stress protein [Mycolicibacterium sp. CBMA 234]MUL65464.1 universal stress protein UspA [Mycolicibacterium sp. CBMA 234]
MNSPRIAVAYLATPGGNDAVAVGEQIAHTLGAEIDLCMVLPSERPALAAIPGNVLLREAEGWLAAAAAGVRNDIAVTTHLSFDESSTSGLIAAAEDVGAEVLVVGGAGGGIASSLSLGSVVNDLVHASPIPVVIAPRGARLTRNERIREVTCAVGTRPGAGALLKTALRFCRDTETPLRLVSLVAVDNSDDLELAQQHAQNALDQARSFLPDDIPVSSRVASGPTVEDAVNKLGWNDGDVIMVGSSRLAQPSRLFLGSTAAKMLRVLQVPMIVVPKDEGADND